jgi:hypothetical protein
MRKGMKVVDDTDVDFFQGTALQGEVWIVGTRF